MIYNVGGGYYLEFSHWLRMTTIRKGTSFVLFVMFIIKVIVLDLFAEIHKICVAKFSLYFEISIDSRFPESY